MKNSDVIGNLINSLEFIGVSKKFVPSAYKCAGRRLHTVIYSWNGRRVATCPMDAEFEIPWGENVTSDGQPLEEFVNEYPGEILFCHQYDACKENPIDKWSRIELVD